MSTLIVPALPGCAAVLGSVGESMLVAQSRATLATDPDCDGKARSDIREEERILFLKSCLSLSSTAPSVLRLLPQKLGHRPKTQGDAALWTWVLYPIPHIARLRSRVWRAWGGRWTGFPNRVASFLPLPPLSTIPEQSATSSLGTSTSRYFTVHQIVSRTQESV